MIQNTIEFDPNLIEIYQKNHDFGQKSHDLDQNIDQIWLRNFNKMYQILLKITAQTAIIAV